MKTTLDVVHILKELNIPCEIFERWSIDGMDPDPVSESPPESPFLRDANPRQILGRLHSCCV